MAIKAAEMHTNWVQEIMNKGLDWEHGMSLAEEITNEAITTKQYGLIVVKRDSYAISFISKMPMMKLEKALRTSFEQLNLLLDEPNTNPGSQLRSAVKRNTINNDRNSVKKMKN